MADFKDILLHIFSQTAELEELPNASVNSKLGDSYKKAFEYACGGKVNEAKTQKPLQSIFDGLGKDAIKQGWYFEPKELSIQDFNFPKKENLLTNSDEVFKKFKNDYKQIEGFQGKAFAETCLALLEKYFCYVSCGIEGLEDVSLYDYIKSVAGFMVCLQNTEIDQEKPILLIGGDISGIQAFIYDIISTDASKNLKGRSFYLQLLVDSVIRRILKELKLFSGNIVYASGGGFYILAPNTDKVKEDLKKLEIEISTAIFKTHKTAFSLVIAWEEIRKDTILKDNLIVNSEIKDLKDQKTVWDTLIQQINRKQKQKFKHQVLNNFDDFFGDNGIEVGGNQERDAITGEEFEGNEQKFEVDEDNKDKKIKKTTQEQIELGSDLRNVEFLVTSEQPLTNKSLKTYNPCDLGIHYWFATDLSEVAKKIDFGEEAFTLNTINLPKEFLKAFFQNSPHTYTFSFYGGNDYPIIRVENKKGNRFYTPKTFSEMAGQKDEDKNRKYVDEFKEPSYKRLGVLRMDVDGLGAIFSGTGLGSFVRYSVLSRSLDYFFKGYLNDIWRNNNDFRENTQIIYSGGDDLFIVGRWDILIDFAEKIQKEFERWSCFNDKFGISGGIAIVTPKFPISKAADMSGDYESKAKKHQHPKDENTKVNEKDKWEKNSINIFGKSLHWQNEYPTVKRLKDKFFELGDDVKATSMKIQGFHAEKEAILEDLERISKQEPSIRKDHTASWRWQLAYDIARTKERYKNKKELKEFLDKIKVGIFAQEYDNFPKNKTEYEFFDLLALAARWAELEKRTKK